MNFFSFLFKKRFPNAETRSTLVAGPFTIWKLLAFALLAACLILVYIIIVRANDALLVTVPSRGGTLTEGIIGAPRALGPLSAVTDTDVSLTNLIFAGLMREEGDGTVVPELAESFSVSPDGLTYTFLLRQKLVFSDNTPLTASDVAATFQALQDPAANPRSSPYWQNVSISTPNPTTVIATIPMQDDTFLQRMTVGIMKTAALQQEETPAQATGAASTNASPIVIPIGAGPFKLSTISYDDSGAPKKLFFVRNRHYALGSPFLKNLNVAVYANQTTLLSALSHNDIDLTFALSPETLTPDALQSDATFTAIPTDRTVGIWQLQNSELSSESLLATLNRFIDKTSIVATIENGYGIPAVVSDSTDSMPLSLEDAQDALEKSGYTVSNGVLSRGKTPVTLSIATLSDPTLLATAHAMTQSFAALGTITQVLSFDQGTLTDDLNAHVLPLILTDETFPLPAAYSEAIPLYTEATVLSETGTVHGVSLDKLDSPTLRYADVAQWHARTDRVWKFLAHLSN